MSNKRAVLLTTLDSKGTGARRAGPHPRRGGLFFLRGPALSGTDDQTNSAVREFRAALLLSMVLSLPLRFFQKIKDALIEVRRFLERGVSEFRINVQRAVFDPFM